MKKIEKIKLFISTTFFFLTVCAASFLSAQVVDNPAKPKAADAGRVIAPPEVLTITDEGGEFYFKYPRNLKVGPEGSLFVQDENQFLQFDKNGKFVRNLFQKGQGPGEMNFLGGYDFAEGTILVFAGPPYKVMKFDGQGKYLAETLLPAKYRILRLLGRAAGRLVFNHFEFPMVKGDSQYVDNPQNLVSWEDGAKDFIPLTPFPVKIYAVTSSGRSGGFFDIGQLITAPYRDKFVVLSHTSEYLLKLFDVEANKVVREFRRDYKRMPPLPLKPGQKPGQIMINDKTYTAPEQKYAKDIANILIRGDEIWAVTSTLDKDKGVLIDVFDKAGSYRDAFYLKIPENALLSLRSSMTSALSGDSLFVAVRTEDETYALKKYSLKY